MSEELSCTQRPFPRTLWRVFGRDILSLARPLSYENGKFQTGFQHSPPICISLHCPSRRCRSAVAAAYTVSTTLTTQDADAPLRFVLCPYPSLRSPSSLPSSGMGGHSHATGSRPFRLKDMSQHREQRRHSGARPASPQNPLFHSSITPSQAPLTSRLCPLPPYRALQQRFCPYTCSRFPACRRNRHSS